MLKNTFFMTVSTVMRLLTGVVLFMVLARVWGVETFGEFAYLSTATLLLSLIVDYGYAQQLLRDIGYAPGNIKAIVNEAFITKVFLSVILLAFSIAFAPFLLVKHFNLYLFYLLLAASILNSFAEFFNIAFRGLGKFHRETSTVTVTNFVYFVLVIFLAYLRQGPVVVAGGVVFSRGFYLFLSYKAYCHEVGRIRKLSFCARDIVSSLRKGFYFCADSALTNLYAQIDTLIVNAFLGPAGVGIYQAGLRLMLGANTFTQVLSSVYLPVVSNKLEDRDQFYKTLCKMFMQMLLIGGACCLIFIIGAEWIPNLVYGSKYAALTPLFPYFGILLLLRYLAAAHGVTLTASGLQGTRVYSIMLAVLALAISACFLVPTYGLKGMLVSSIIAILTLHLFYVMRLLYNRIPLGLNRNNVIASVVVFVLVSIAVKFV